MIDCKYKVEIKDIQNKYRFKIFCTGSYQDISGKEDKANKVTSISSSSTDQEYPSAKCVYTLIGNLESILEELDIGGGVV